MNCAALQRGLRPRMIFHLAEVARTLYIACRSGCLGGIINLRVNSVYEVFQPMRTVKSWWVAPVLLVLLAGCRPSSSDRLDGAWAGFAYSPGGEIVDLTYNVTAVADSFVMTVEMPQGPLPTEQFRIRDGEMSFVMNPTFRMECRLLREESGLYKGGCIDGERRVGPMVVAPPGQTVAATDLDVDKVFEVWGLSRADYELEHYGRRRTEKANLENMLEAAPAGRLVEVDGREVYLVEQGEGGVTVVLEAGLGDDHTVWRTLQDTLATFARVVAYDRAGLGQSAAVPDPRTPGQVADELHALLQRAGVPPPYVLVGHEAGGLYVRAFAARHPDRVAGLVLIDPAHEQLGARWRALDAASWDDYVQKKKAFHQVLPGAIGAEFEAYAALLEAGQFPEAAALPNVPTVVITGARPAEAPRWVGETPAGVQAKREVHAAWAARRPLTTHRVTENAGPYVHHEDPGVVVEAIREVVEAARAEQ